MKRGRILMFCNSLRGRATSFATQKITPASSVKERSKESRIKKAGQSGNTHYDEEREEISRCQLHKTLTNMMVKTWEGAKLFSSLARVQREKSSVGWDVGQGSKQCWVVCKTCVALPADTGRTHTRMLGCYLQIHPLLPSFHTPPPQVGLIQLPAAQDWRDQCAVVLKNNTRCWMKQMI